MLTGPTPALTPAQILGLATFVVGQAVAWGWLTQERSQIAVSVASTVIAVVLKLADAYLRAQRNKAHPTVPPPPSTT